MERVWDEVAPPHLREYCWPIELRDGVVIVQALDAEMALNLSAPRWQQKWREEYGWTVQVLSPRRPGR